MLNKLSTAKDAIAHYKRSRLSLTVHLLLSLPDCRPRQKNRTKNIGQTESGDIMNHTVHITEFSKRITIANVINSICIAVLCLVEITVGISIKSCQGTIVSLMGYMENPDPDSYIGGYQIVGGFFGAGAMTLIVGILYLLFVVSALYFVAFLIENIRGYRLVSRLKKEPYSESLLRKIRGNAIFKLILALLVILPIVCAALWMQTVELLLLSIPQVVVLVLTISIIRTLPKIGAMPEPRISTGEEQ